MLEARFVREPVSGRYRALAHSQWKSGLTPAHWLDRRAPRQARGHRTDLRLTLLNRSITTRASAHPDHLTLGCMLDNQTYASPATALRGSGPAPCIARERVGRWCERLTLPNGRRVLVRPLEASDADALRASFGALSPEEVRLRFQAPMREMSAEMAGRLCDVDDARGFALCVTEDLPQAEALIGAVVRGSIDAGTRDAEFAIIVGRPLAGQGLGWYLMQRLLHWVRAKRLDCVYGDVLIENQAMLKLTDALDFSRQHRPGDQGLVRVERRLRQSANAGPLAAEHTPESE